MSKKCTNNHHTECFLDKNADLFKDIDQDFFDGLKDLFKNYDTTLRNLADR